MSALRLAATMTGVVQLYAPRLMLQASLYATRSESAALQRLVLGDPAAVAAQAAARQHPGPMQLTPTPFRALLDQAGGL